MDVRGWPFGVLIDPAELQLIGGPEALFDDDTHFIELAGRRQFDIPPNEHPDYRAGSNRAAARRWRRMTSLTTHSR